jgi:glycosyltransferase involved in cell wall biosynthesis
MRVGIDTLFEDPAVGTGGVTYIHNLVHGLAAREENEYVLYVSPQNRHLFEIDRPNVRHVVCPFSKERRLGTIAFQQSVLPLLARRDELDVFHAPGNIAPFWLPCASVLTVHTVQHWTRPTSLPAGQRHFRRMMMPRSIRRADVVIAVSEYVRTTLEERCRLDGKAITIYSGGPEYDADLSAPAEEVPEGAILFVSALWPYKNAEVAIRAHAHLRFGHNLTQPLVIAGTGFASYEAKLRELARSERVADSVLFLGHVPQSRMAAVYASAAVLIYPSLEESFGLPVLEAMSAGVPVIASDRTAVREVVDDAGLLVDATDASVVADALARVLIDDDLRRSLVERGQARAATFTWQRTAEETAASYGAALDRRMRNR